MSLSVKSAETDSLHRAATPEARRSGAVLVFAAELLPYSETFIRDHVASIRDRNAILVGAKPVAGLSTEGLETALLPNSRWARVLLWFAGISPAMDRIVEAHGIKLIHAHFADAGARLARYAARRKLPLLVTLHGADVLRRPEGAKAALINRLLWPRLMRSAALFLPVSDYLRDKAAKRGFPEVKLRRHYLGIPLFPPFLRRATAAPPTILFIGRMVEKKGLPHLFEAAMHLADADVDFRLRIVGDGPLLARSRRRAQFLDGKVTFLGRLPPERVREELRNADIVCMPSIEAADGDNEGLPIVALEAQAAGLPVVAFAQGPVPECIISGSTGLLAKERNATDLAACLERLLRNPELRLKMGREGRRHVETHFDIERQSEELERIYEDVLARASGGGGQA
jgi:colanic acid/amylovoran biosynthesis glycosyltransferase